MANQMRLGAVLSYTSIAVNLLVGLTYTPFMIRMMGPSEYGLYSLAASIVSYLTVLDLGFGNAIVRYTAKFRAERDTQSQETMFGMFIILYSFIAVLALIIGAGIISCSGQLFGTSMSDTEVSRTKIILIMLIFNVSITFPLSIWGSIMTAYERFVFPKIVSIARSIINALVMVALLLLGYRAIALVVVITVLNVVSLSLNWIYCKEKLHINVRFARINWSFLKEVSIYSFWIFLNVLMDKAYWSTGQIVLGASSGTTAVSQFAIAIQLLSYYMLLNVAISNMLLPRLTAMVVSGKDTEISDFIVKVSRLQYFLIAMVFAGFIVFGKRFVIMWAGPDYEVSFYIALALFVPMTADILLSSCVKVLQARNEMKFRSLVCLFSAALCVLFQIPVSHKFGAIGCALAISFVFVIQIVILVLYYQKKQRIQMDEVGRNLFRMSVVPLLLMSVFALSRHMIPSNGTICYVVSIALFAGLYIFLQYKFVLNEYEKGLCSAFIVYVRNSRNDTTR